MQMCVFTLLQYLTLLRAIANTLELEEIQGLRALAHMPKDERERLVLERESACEFLAGRIQVLKERIARKDELLQGYERDLSKLRCVNQQIHAVIRHPSWKLALYFLFCFGEGRIFFFKGFAQVVNDCME